MRDRHDETAATEWPQPARRRILISAFAASPDRGSEPAVGWNIPLRLAARHDVTVLCIPRFGDEPFSDEIGAYLREHGSVPGLRFHFVEPPPLFRRLERYHRNGSLLRSLYYVGYAAWQKRALQEALQLHHERPFDLVHHLNIIGYREPGYLWQLDIPFVWGPLGGAADMPWSYFPLLSRRDMVFYALRNVANHWQKHLRMRCRRAARAAARIWVVSEADRHMVDHVWRCSSDLLLETGTSPHPAARHGDYDGRRPLRIIWSGLHIGRKALPILLHALHRIPGPPETELRVLGEGPETGEWHALADRLGLKERIQWMGRLGHGQALQELARADVCVFTGLQEGTPHTVLEALSLGVPVICHDACGMGLAVTDQCGMRIPMHGPSQSIAGFAAAIEHLRQHPEQVALLSAGALRRAAELSWDAKARCIAQVYQEILAGPNGSGKEG